MPEKVLAALVCRGISRAENCQSLEFTAVGRERTDSFAVRQRGFSDLSSHQSGWVQKVLRTQRRRHGRLTTFVDDLVHANGRSAPPHSCRNVLNSPRSRSDGRNRITRSGSHHSLTFWGQTCVRLLQEFVSSHNLHYSWSESLCMRPRVLPGQDLTPVSCLAPSDRGYSWVRIA